MAREIEPAVITRLRTVLAAQVRPPLEVSAKGHQYFFDEESAAYSDIDVKRGEAFAVVVVQGQLPSEELIVRIWHRYADEVWLVDRSDQMISIIPRQGLIRVFAIGETLQTARMPEVSIAISDVFDVAN